MLPVDRVFYLKDKKIDQFLTEILHSKLPVNVRPTWQDLLNDLNRKTKEHTSQEKPDNNIIPQGDLYGLTLKRFKQEGPQLTGLWNKKILLNMEGHRSRDILTRVRLFEQSSSMLQRFMLDSPHGDNVEVGRLAILSTKNAQRKIEPLNTYYIKVNKLDFQRSEKVMQFLRASSPLADGPPYISGLDERESLLQFHLMR